METHTKPQETHAAGIDKVAKLIKGIRTAFLTTKAGDGSFHARPMARQDAPFDGTLTFITELSSPKVAEIQRDDEVSVTFTDQGSNTFVALSGTAETRRDPARAKALWGPFTQAWFPNGPEDPNVGVMTVHIHKAEYWDGPTFKLVALYEVVKANLTHTQPKIGDHGVVRV